jgi:hypothetical protein
MPRYIVTVFLAASLALSAILAHAEPPNVVYQNGDWMTYWTRSNKQGHQMCGIQFIGNKADDRRGLYVKHIKVSDDDQYIEVQLTRTAWRIAVGTVIDAALTVSFDNDLPINVKAKGSMPPGSNLPWVAFELDRDAAGAFARGLIEAHQMRIKFLQANDAPFIAELDRQPFVVELNHDATRAFLRCENVLLLEHGNFPENWEK